MGHEPKQALRLGLQASLLCFTAKVDGKPEAMFGLVVTNALCGEGTPWMLGTDEVYRHGRTLVEWGPRMLAMFRDSTPHLSNVVAVQNAPAIRFLRRLGFTIGEEVILFAATEFVTFSTERS
jgi:ribosomal protein S18 acetylase RimI-like enzyme